jgi:hypothetical protein
MLYTQVSAATTIDQTESDQQLNDMYMQQKMGYAKSIQTIDTQTYSELRKYQTIDYNIHKNQFHRMYLKYSFAVASILFMIASLNIMGFISSTATMITIGAVALIYTTVFYVDVKKNMLRRTHDWNKFYFNALVKKPDA